MMISNWKKHFGFHGLHKIIQCYSTVQLKLVEKTKFPFISPTCFTHIPLRGIFVKQFSPIFPFLARLLILIKKGGLLQLKFVGVGVNIYLWARLLEKFFMFPSQICFACY